MKWLLLLMPIAAALEHFAPGRPLLTFAVAALAIIPLCALMARATGSLAVRLGAGVGGLLNATFGNAAEFIIAFAALRGGLYDMVKASLAGTIIGNILLVTGVAMFVGGLGRKEQLYNATAVRSLATMLTLGVIALILPAAFHASAPPGARENIGPISNWIAVILLATYAANVLFTLVTNKELFTGGGHGDDGHGHGHEAEWAPKKAALVLGAVTLGIVWMSEILVAAVEPAAASLGLTDLFAGVFVLAVLGGAAEQATAIVAARHDRMDLSLSIALGSSVQLALMVAPLLVLLSYVVGPHPMDLVFRPGLVFSIMFAVLICGQLTSDGRSHWLRGVQLLAVYLILAVVFYFVPDAAG